MSEVRQFKLVDGSEIVCEVIEWNDDETDEIIMRNALVIQYMIRDDHRLCSMRPWMLQQVQNDYLQTLNAGHITVDAKPALETLANYEETVQFLQVNLEELNEETLDDLIEIDEEEKDNILNFVKSRKDKLH